MKNLLILLAVSFIFSFSYCEKKKSPNITENTFKSDTNLQVEATSTPENKKIKTESNNVGDSEKMKEVKPGYIDELYKNGMLLVSRRETKEAIKYFDKIIELKPDHIDAWYNKGITLYDLGKKEEAIKCYDKIIEMKPDFADAWYNKGITLFGLGKKDEAQKCFNKADELRKIKKN